MSTHLVVAEAARIADEVGFEGLTLAAVAERFGVAVPSLYKHVGGLDDLRRRVAVLAIEELGQLLAAAARDDRSGLDAMADAYRRYALDHPGRYAATIRAADPSDTDGIAVRERVLGVVTSVLAGHGVAGVDAIDAARVLRASLHGFVALETAGGFGIPRDVDRSFRRLVALLDEGFRSWPAQPVGGAETSTGP